MNADVLEVSLRVLYTVNTSPQYILAKSPDKIPFIPVEGSSSSNPLVKYGKASLKACALAICRSSPELRPDATKDFSVYILDPLEDLASKNRLGQSGGVAVGMGLLSRILSPSTLDPSMVAGTFVCPGQGTDALEVVISLRQVGPPVMHGVDSHSRDAPSLSRTKSSSKRSGKDEPYLTSQPLPLPSLDERLLASYRKPLQSDTPGVRSKERRKPDPAHSTRAHQLPTPYIGPPKRKYLREADRKKEATSDGTSGRDFRTGPGEARSSPLSVGKYSDTSLGETANVLSNGDTTNPVPNAVHHTAADLAPDYSEAAVMLAALSSVSSRPSEPLPAQASTCPGPELVSFLRAYLAHLEGQNQLNETEDISSSVQPSPSQSHPASSEHSLLCAAETRTSLEALEDKENQKPSSSLQSSKDQKPTGSGGISPLGSSLFNARSSGSQPSNTGGTGTLLSSSACRKRKLSNATLSEQSSQTRRRSSSISNPKPLTEDLSGIRQNRGWGGLRVRSDGTLWGEQPPRAPSNGTSSVLFRSSSEQPVFFRSSGQNAPAPARKGPYVVPDWAKGVPPPAPPPRPEVTNTGKEQSCRVTKGLSKSKSLGRLGGKAALKRTASTAHTTKEFVMPTARPASPKRCSWRDSSVDRSPRPSARESPGRLPIFAYSSPVGKSKMASLFQAFQTSPCQPTSHRKASPSTPVKSSDVSPGDSAEHSSLFTPTPLNSKTRTDSRHNSRTLFEGEEPPSPTPTRRRIMTPKASTNRTNTGKSASSELTRKSHDENEENDSDLPSSLPIASSDSLLEGNSSPQELSTSSDSTIMNFSKVHDWSSLDLPPSSPPPPSSPCITAVGGSDLPPSDISCDSSEADSPAPASDLTSSCYPSPAANGGQSNLLGFTEGRMEFVADTVGRMENTGMPSLTDTTLPFDLTGEEGPSALAAFEALRNGLGQEDFSEGWNLFNSLLRQDPLNDGGNDAPITITNSDRPGDAQGQSWIVDNLGSTSELEFDSFFSAEIVNSSSAFDILNDEDPAVTAASTLKDLLHGCLV